MISQASNERADDDEQFETVRRHRKKGLRRFRRRGGKVATIVPYPEDQVSVEGIDMVMKNACSNSELVQYR